MAWFTQISNDNIVQQVMYVTDNHNIYWVLQTYGGNWIEVSENNLKNFPSIGYSYDANNNKFIPSQPYPSWILNEESFVWEAPIAYPNDGKYYTWDETSLNWLPKV